MPTLSQTLDSLNTVSANKADIMELTRGVEKESLRITPGGTLAMSPHPKALGSALTHPHITTDYSEALLEFITAPDKSRDKVLTQLHELHDYTYQHIGSERLWGTSMPCMLSNRDEDIPIAHYGSSNSGTMKSVYRLGLGQRYGRSMQTIAGVHYNFSVSDALWQHLKTQENSSLSLQDFKTQGYFRLIRNFRRDFWLLLYLFGASPAVCNSFVHHRKHNLVPFGHDEHSLYAPYATSLRMGNLGYQSNAQESLVITYNCLESYISTLCNAITQAHPEYAKRGIQDSHGNYQQLNDCLLQIENEFYSVIRPKRTAQPGETALSALANGGIEYIEVRCLDINPYEPIGISASQMQFLDTFLLYCLLTDSPHSTEKEHLQIQENQKRMVYSGRDPQLRLYKQGVEHAAREWGQQIMDKLEDVAKLLDSTSSRQVHLETIKRERKKLSDDSLTISARILEDMKQENVTFYRFAMNLSEQHQQHFTCNALTNRHSHYQTMATASLAQQAQLEQQQEISFKDYLAQYYSQYQSTHLRTQQAIIAESQSY